MTETTCSTCKNNHLCLNHSTVKDVLAQGYEGVWWLVRQYLFSPNEKHVREKERKILVRRLMHSEGSSGIVPAKMPRWDDPRPTPRWDSPLCVCGAKLSSHDMLSGECSSMGCEMFCPVP